jgi:hypothetical protein
MTIEKKQADDGLTLLREAVEARKACHQAYREHSSDRGKIFPSRDEVDKEVRLRTALGLAERAVLDAAEYVSANIQASQPLESGATSNSPTPGLLMSMAIRYDHGLGVPGYYDSLLGPGEHQKKVMSTLAVMAQLYEEISGQGFYSPDREDHYRTLAQQSEPRP